jgi:hypothetical protein
MLAYRRVPLRQSIVIWSCGPWRSPWRVASTTWPRPLETCSSGVQWGGRGCVYVNIDTGVLMVVWYIFPHVKCWNVITIYHHDHPVPSSQVLDFLRRIPGVPLTALGERRIAPSLRHLQGLQPGRGSGSPPRTLLGRWFLLGLLKIGFWFYLGLV